MLHTRIFTFNPLGTNCVVMWAGGQDACTVVDPGMHCDDSVRELEQFLAAQHLTPDAVFLTHGHFDHVWGVEKFLELHNVPVYMHPADRPLAEDGSSAIPGAESFKSFRHSFPSVDIADGDVLQSAGTAWKVIHTPGHSPGSVCYYSADNNLLLSGDTLFAGSIGRTDLRGGDYDVLMASIKEKLLVLPGVTDVVPGHGQPTSIAREGMYNPFLEPFNEPPDEDNMA